jgi:hypothetical protein
MHVRIAFAVSEVMIRLVRLGDGARHEQRADDEAGQEGGG